jgi:hypothetical protein
MKEVAHRRGRPPLTPRINGLEERIAKLERQVAALSGSLNVGPPANEYKPLFERWPGA